jgi:hypothetical protein
MRNQRGDAVAVVVVVVVIEVAAVVVAVGYVVPSQFLTRLRHCPHIHCSLAPLHTAPLEQ